jgi:hypothetical protein
MSADLLATAIAAHGGLDRWNEYASVRANASVGGVLWALKGRSGVLADITVEARLHEQRVTIHLNGRALRYSFVPGRVAVEDESGRVVSERAEPRAAFRGHTVETPWDDLHLAYFTGYALWTYLTIPFLYTYPGFVTEELLPWSENGEVWRPLKARFPADVASHAREQVSYFGPDGLLRRHEYVAEVLGRGGSGLNYAADYRTVGGIVVPVTSRVYAADVEHHKIADPLLASIDLRDISFNSE